MLSRLGLQRILELHKSWLRRRRCTLGVLAVRSTIALKRVCRDGWQYLRDRAKSSLECRECGQPNGLLQSVCGYCGAGNPVRIGVSPMVLVTGAGCELTILILQLI